MTGHGVFPFGQKVKLLRQLKTTRKNVFVLGVYASAVHARWVGRSGHQKVAALAVASEPYIFWTGEGAEEIVSSIRFPPSLGKLLPAGKRFNGPSGRSLEVCFLSPLGISRDYVWLCDVYPYAMVNRNQLKAIRREYAPLASKFRLPQASLEMAPMQSPGSARIQEIMTELKLSGARTLILLGDRPIKWFLGAFHTEYRRLSDFGRAPSQYGQLHPIELEGYRMDVLPLVHPRQASRLGKSSASWGHVHDEWMRLRAPTLLRSA